FGSAFVKNPIRFGIEIDLKLQLEKNEEVSLLATGIDLTSLQFDADKYVREFFMDGVVRDRILEELEKAHKKLVRSAQYIARDLPIPREILGLHLRIEKIQLDPGGHFLAFVSRVEESALTESATQQE